MNEGASPDRVSLKGRTQTEAAPALFFWAPWRGREASESFFIRGRTLSRDQISVIEEISQGLPSENLKILGLSPFIFRGTYKSRLTQKSMGQVSVPEKQCHLIRGRGHWRPLLQNRGPLGTGLPHHCSRGQGSCARFASPEDHEREFLGQPASLNNSALRLRQLRRRGTLRAR